MSGKVTIIVPVYNTEKQLAKCMDSLLAQTCKNIEIVAVNDGSTDKSAEVLETYRGEGRVRIVTKANGGLSDARNAGMKVATGDWIMFVDSDDAIHPELVERSLKAAEREQADFVRYEERNVEPEKVVEFEPAGEVESVNFEDAVRYYLDSGLMPSACLCLYKAALVMDMRFVKGLIYEDLDFNYRFFRRVKRGVHLKWKAYNYAQTTGSITRSTMTDKKLESIDFIVRHLADEYAKAGDARLKLLKRRLFSMAVKKQILKPLSKLSENEQADFAGTLAKTVGGLIKDGLIRYWDFSPKWWPILAKARLNKGG